MRILSSTIFLSCYYTCSLISTSSPKVIFQTTCAGYHTLAEHQNGYPPQEPRRCNRLRVQERPAEQLAAHLVPHWSSPIPQIVFMNHKKNANLVINHMTVFPNSSQITKFCDSWFMCPPVNHNHSQKQKSHFFLCTDRGVPYPSVVLLFCVLRHTCALLLGDYAQLQWRVSP